MTTPPVTYPVSTPQPPQPPGPAPIELGEALPVGTPSPPESSDALAFAAQTAGCIPRSSAGTPIPKLQPANCGVATPYYYGSTAECTESWCSSQPLSIQSCEPVAVSIAGGYHYAVTGDGFDADFFFAPGSSSSIPVKENFGWVHLRLDLGTTIDALHPVSIEADLSFDEAFAAGLDVVEGTIIGILRLEPLASGVQGPLYQPSCDFVTDEVGRVVPGPCACRLPSSTFYVPLYVPLDPSPLE